MRTFIFRPVRLALVAFPLVALAIGLAACGESTASPVTAPDLRSDKVRVESPEVSTADAEQLKADNLAFAVDVHHQLRTTRTGENFIFSQTSISTALAMLYAGAATTTAAQTATAMHFGLPPERLHAAFNALDLALSEPAADGNAFRLRLANSAWVQKDFAVLPAYLDTLALNYGAGLFVQDFETQPESARAVINKWVSDRTEAQIPDLFPPGSIRPSTRLVLANAVFFHGDWLTPFKANSKSETFHAPGGDVSVPMMHGSNNGRLWEGAGYRAASLDYVGDTTSMIVLVPDAGTFDTFEAGLTATGLTAALAPATSGSGDVVMPRFTFETAAPLNEILQALGMTDAFVWGLADLSGIDGDRDLSVDDVLHRAIINVDEKGTTAAAATGVIVGIKSVQPTLLADRPFLFFIRHNPTGAILFQGRVLNPATQ